VLDQPGYDTPLARLLHARGRVPLPVLQGALSQTRDTRPTSSETLAQTLVGRGLLTAPEAETYLSQLVATNPTQLQAGLGLPEAPGVQLSAVSGTSPQAAATGAWSEGTRVGDYTVLRELGAGGMGAVHLVQHVQTGGQYALKTLLVQGDVDLVLRFQREAEAQARVDRHPNVVRVHASGQSDGRLYMVMDLAAGGDLEARLEGGPLDPLEAASIVRDLARGLAHVHRHGVLHRDLKPANVLFDEAGTPKLVDFGLASVVGSEALTRTGEILGTPVYMAPEQALGEPGGQDERTDVYGLGALLFHTLTGRPPFLNGPLLRVLDDVVSVEPPSPRSLRPDVPPRLAAICLKTLAKASEERHPSADALADDLDSFLAGDPAAGPTWRAFALGGLVLATLGVTAAAVLGLGREAPGDQVDETQQPAPALAAVDPAPVDPAPVDPAPVDPPPSEDDGLIRDLDQLPPLPAEPPGLDAGVIALGNHTIGSELLRREEQVPLGLSYLREAYLVDGDQEAWAELGELFLRPDDKRPPGVARSVELGLRLLQEAAEAGSARGQWELGQVYERGADVPRSEEEAARLYRLGAVNQSYAGGQEPSKCLVALAQLSNTRPDLVDPAQGDEYLLRVIDDPGPATSVGRLACVLLSNRDSYASRPAERERLLRRVIRHEPKHGTAYSDLGYLLLGQPGREGDAIDAFRGAGRAGFVPSMRLLQRFAREGTYAGVTRAEGVAWRSREHVHHCDFRAHFLRDRR
jgi:Protein kinase domain